jgi:Uma2 family endonuclease
MASHPISSSAINTLPLGAGEPAWEIAELFPYQGQWSEEDYLDLETNRLIEFSDGFLEFLPMPTTSHQLIVFYLLKALDAFVTPAKLGLALLAPLKVRLRSGKIREPDVLFCFWRNRHKIGEKFWTGADLVMEVVSEGGEKRDREEKRAEYAKAGIAEYWIVDPQTESITVLVLEQGVYVVAGEHTAGARAASVLLPGFDVDVAAVFAAGKIDEA